jgi:diguanylate cyclase (GGDEF)-like protein/PAS domain S-box-containing protein
MTAAAAPIVVLVLFHPGGGASLLLDALAWLLMLAVIIAANLERQRRAMSTRLGGHRLMLVGIIIVYGGNALGHLALALQSRTHESWVYNAALLVGVVPVAVGLVRLCWPPGTTVREAWVIVGDVATTGSALAVIWVLVLVPAHVGNEIAGPRPFSATAPWAQYAGLLAIVVVAASSRRPGALPVRQLILLQAAVIAFITGDIVGDLLADRLPDLGQAALLTGAWIAALLYRYFGQRPAMEDEGPSQFLVRSVWSVSVPAIVLVLMVVTVVGYRLLVGPLPESVVVFVLLALVLASGLVTAQRILLAGDVEAGRMARVRATLEDSAQVKWFGALLSQSHDLVTVVDHSGTIVFQTPAITTLFGYERGRLTGSHVSVLFEDVTPEHLNRRLQESLHRSDFDTVDMVLTDADGEPHETETVIIPLRTDGADGYVLTTRDVTDRLRLRAALAESGQRDQLTGLNNRDGFLSRLEQLLPSTHEGLAVALLDIVSFREINDSRGHAVGDALLRSTASAIDRLPPSALVAARIGADEFAIVIVADNVERELGHVDRMLREALRRVVVADGPALDAEFCLGYVTRLPLHDTPEALMERADLALAAARTAGSRTPVKYERGMRSALVMRLRQESDLRAALDSDRLLVHYQPIIELASSRLVSVEALVRMRGTDGALVPPDRFIPLAEELGLIARVGEKVLDVALSDIGVISARLGRDISVAVNFSADQIEPGLPAIVGERLQAHGISARALTVEVTESSLVRHSRSASILGALRKMGCEIAIDDFGTGYSSLSYLVGLPVDELKIDRSFIGQLASSYRSLSLVRVLLQMAATLGLEVVAEGVETVEQADLLRGMGCQRAQGYLYAAPMSLPEVLEAVAGSQTTFRFTR